MTVTGKDGKHTDQRGMFRRCSYDAAGNMTRDERAYQYQYDYENRIVEILDSNSDTVAQFAYDALGKRIMRFTNHDSQTTYYYYNNNRQVLSQTNAAGG